MSRPSTLTRASDQESRRAPAASVQAASRTARAGPRAARSRRAPRVRARRRARLGRPRAAAGAHDCAASRSWRLTANPTRVDSVDSRQSTMSEGRSIRLPRWKSAWNSALVVSRWRRERPPLRRSAVCGLSRDGASTPCVRPSSSYARETRESWPGGADWVETSASSSSSPFRSLNRHSVGTHSKAVNQRTRLRRRETPC